MEYKYLVKYTSVVDNIEKSVEVFAKNELSAIGWANEIKNDIKTIISVTRL